MRVSEVYGVPRHDLAGLTRLAPVFKHELLGSFRVAGAPNNQQRTNASAKDNVAGEPITWNPRHSHMIEELLHRYRPRAVTLMTAAEPATASVILTKTPGFSQKHAKWFKAQVCAQLLAAMTDPANDKIFNAKLGKLLHLPHAQSSSTPEPSTSTVTGKKRKSRGGANAKPKPKKAAKMKAAPKKKSEKDPIAEDEEDEEIEDEEDVEEENLSEDSVGSDD